MIAVANRPSRANRIRAERKARRDAIRAFNVRLLRDVWGFTIPDIVEETGLARRTVQRAYAEGCKALPPRVIEALQRLVREVDAHGFRIAPDPPSPEDPDDAPRD